MTGALIKDTAWVRNAFLVSAADAGKAVAAARTMTTASQKFTDTTPGGNFCINPPPQFTRYADPKALSAVALKTGAKSYSSFPGSKGMGRYYSEAIDDHNQLIYLRFGVPEFNSLTTFFTGFYDSSAGQLARTGRADSAFYTLGKAAGLVVSVVYWPLLLVNMIGNGLRFFLQKPSSKFYFLKPTMPVYWNAVQTMVNHLAVNRGIVPRIGAEDPKQRFGEPYDFDKEGLAKLNELLPEIFNKGGGIDVFAMATRGQRLARKKHKIEQQIRDQDGVDLATVIRQTQDAALTDNRVYFADYQQKWFNSAPSKPKSENGKDDVNTEQLDPRPDANSSWLEFLEAELDDGGAFACFRVNSTGTVEESFTSSTGESDIAQKINSMSSASRSTNFNFANGNILGGVAGDILGGVANSVKDFARGAADSLNIAGVAALGGAAFVDIPHHWQSSTAQLPRASYTINLRSWSGDPISQLINLYVPLCMLLAGALPLSTGRHSYTSPFICELYDQGRCQTRLGMIDSLSVSRGQGNLGFNSDGNVMGIDVTFSVIDLSTIMHIPVSEGFKWSGAQAGASAGAVVGTGVGAVTGGIPGAAVGAAAGTAAGAAVGTAVDAVSAIGAAIKGCFSDDTPFNDYMAVLAGMSVTDQIYSWRKLKLNATRQLVNLKSMYSIANYTSFMADSVPGRVASWFYKGIIR
jgi:hypothetical protein